MFFFFYIAKDFCCNDELVEEFIDFLNLDKLNVTQFVLRLYNKEAFNFGLINEQGG